MSVRRWLAHRVGRRGAFLAFLAVLDFGYGYSLLAASAPTRTLDLMLPWQAWGVIWLVVGASCLSGVFVVVDRVQFALAATVKVAWGLLFLKLWLVQGLVRGWVSAVIWLAFALTVLLISGWPEPPPKLPPLPPEMESPRE